MNYLSAEIMGIFIIALIAIAFLYASVGHGGASGYIALMATFSFPLTYIKPTALILNVFISGISFFYFKKHNHFKWKLFYPFAIASIPAAFLGGYIAIDPKLYKIILGVFLAAAILRILLIPSREQVKVNAFKPYTALFIGCGIGFLSGMIGIGGGIILSPIIIILGWANMKTAAAISALFIFVNSISGIIGYSLTNQIEMESFKLIPIALVGGVLGAIYGSNKVSNKVLKQILSVVLLIACVKLMVL